MLRSRATSAALSRVAASLGSGCSALLLAADGRLLAHSGGDVAAGGSDARLAGCIASRAFSEYAAAAAGLERQADVEFIWLACEVRRSLRAPRRNDAAKGARRAAIEPESCRRWLRARFRHVPNHYWRRLLPFLPALPSLASLRLCPLTTRCCWPASAAPMRCSSRRGCACVSRRRRRRRRCHFSPVPEHLSAPPPPCLTDRRRPATA